MSDMKQAAKQIFSMLINIACLIASTYGAIAAFQFLMSCVAQFIVLSGCTGVIAIIVTLFGGAFALAAAITIGFASIIALSFIIGAICFAAEKIFGKGKTQPDNITAVEESALQAA